MSKISKICLIFLTISLVTGLASANQFEDDESFFEEEQIEIVDNWDEFIDISQEHLTVEDGTLIYDSSDSNSETILETDNSAIYSEVETGEVDVAGTSTLNHIIGEEGDYGTQTQDSDVFESNSLTSVSYSGENTLSTSIFFEPTSYGMPVAYPFTISIDEESVEDVNNIQPQETVTITSSYDNAVIYVEEDGTTTELGNVSSSDPIGEIDYTFPTDDVSEVEIYGEDEDGSTSNNINRYYNDREGLFQSSYGYYELNSMTAMTYHEVERIESYGIEEEDEDEFGTVSVGEDLIQFTENVEVTDDSITVIDPDQKGEVQFESSSTGVLLDVEITGDSEIVSNDLGDVIYSNGEVEREGITTTIKESGVYEFESEEQFTTTLELYENSDITINEISQTDEEEEPPEIDTFMIGQDIDGVVDLQEDNVYQDYYHRDGEVSYVHASRYLLDLDTEDVIDQTGWDNVGEYELGSENEDAIGEHTIEYTDEFNYNLYTEGEYAVGIIVVRSDNQVAGDNLDEETYTVEDWEEYEHSVVSRTEVPFGVVAAEEPQSPIDSIQNFFNGLVESIVSSLETIFDEGEIQYPDLENPPHIS